MLNKIKLERILKSDLPEIQISDIHWKCQESTDCSILFYRINEDKKSDLLFSERISKSKFTWLILNKDHPNRPLNSSIIPEKDWPPIQKEILDILYPLPRIKLIALTGTNGKSTTAELVLQIGELCGKKGISIGTLGVREKNKTVHEFGLTTPDFVDLRKFLNQFGSDKDFCVLEASSHALDQNRLYGLEFDAGGWLSFSQDHLDYHINMENYFAAKMRLFDYLRAGAPLFIPRNQQKLFEGVHNLKTNVFKTKEIKHNLPLFFATSFNRDNLEVAVDVVEFVFQFKVPDIFEKLNPPEGRFFIKPYKSNFIIVDFAHTPDALINICQELKKTFSGYKLKLLFGCGGDRDRSKRSIMGEIASVHADFIYVTSDNPRSEDPNQIISDILKGIKDQSKVRKIVERPIAVAQAFGELTEKEILLLAGKGHEDYILMNGVKFPYSDISEVEKFISKEKKDD